jgi:hypothetical protein
MIPAAIDRMHGSWGGIGGSDFTGLVCSSGLRGAPRRLYPSVEPEPARDFPSADLRDQDACYSPLVGWRHPAGLACPRCGARDRLVIPHCHRDPVLRAMLGVPITTFSPPMSHIAYFRA